MQQCAAIQFYQKHQHYHLSYIGETSVSEEWYRSDECKSYTPYCCNRTQSTNIGIGCEAESECKGCQWYHLRWLGLFLLPGKD